MTEKRKVDVYYVIFPKKTNFIFSTAFDVVDSLKSAVAIVFLIFMFIFRVVGVSGDSMNPTLLDKDWLSITAFTSHYQRGDIVVVTKPWERDIPIIKRVIALPGDTIDINFTSGNVYINGEVIDEPYILERTNLSYDAKFPITVPDGYYFVMGDNRNNSLDSRSSKINMVEERYVLGKATRRIYPNSVSLKNGGKTNE